MEAFKSEKLIATAEGFMCKVCGAHFSRGRARRHIVEVHFDNHGIRYACPECKRFYRNRNSFREHISKYHKEIKGINLDQCQVLERQDDNVAAK